MNILPLVSAFILIFGICSYTFFHHFTAAVIEHRHYRGAHKISRTFASRMQRKTFAKIKANNTETQKSAITTSTVFHSPRDRFNLSPEGKLNISVLLQEGDRPEKEAIFLELIRNLYEYTPHYKPGLENDLLEILKQNPKLTSFEELLIDAPQFYKFVKGTHQYSLEKFEGYPALRDFFIIDVKKKSKLINFSYASRPILEAVFGKVLAPQIINEEKHKWESKGKHSPLTQQELEAFLLKKNKNYVKYAPYIFFSGTKHAKTQDVIQEQRSKIQLKIPL